MLIAHQFHLRLQHAPRPHVGQRKPARVRTSVQCHQATSKNQRPLRLLRTPRPPQRSLLEPLRRSKNQSQSR